MKCRVFKKEDGTVVYNWPTQKWQGKIDECPIPHDLVGLPFVVMEEGEIPESNSRTSNFHEMIHFDGECSKENLKQDKEWKVCLMPPFLIREKHLARLKNKIQENRLDSGVAFEAFLEHEDCKKWSEKRLYEQALKNIEDDGHQKPLVVEKLNAKIKEAT